MALRLSMVNAGLCVAGGVFYALLLAIVPITLFTAFGASKHFCAGVLGLSDARRNDTMVGAFLLVTVYGAWRVAAA